MVPSGPDIKQQVAVLFAILRHAKDTKDDELITMTERKLKEAPALRTES